MFAVGTNEFMWALYERSINRVLKSAASLHGSLRIVQDEN